jgi:3-methyl-2-oxobutanoate hydroxymethyltransferase
MSEQSIYGAGNTGGPRTKIRTHHLQRMKAEGH